MEKKYRTIFIVDGVTNGIVSITKRYDCVEGSDDKMEYFRFQMTSDCVSPNYFCLNKEDAEYVINEIRHGEPVYIGVTNKLDEVIKPFFDTNNFK